MQKKYTDILKVITTDDHQINSVNKNAKNKFLSIFIDTTFRFMFVPYLGFQRKREILVLNTFTQTTPSISRISRFTKAVIRSICIITQSISTALLGS